MNKYRLLLKSKNFYFREILGFLFLLLALYFFRHEAHELKSVGKTIRQSNTYWIIAGIILTIIYIGTQALMYVYSFKTVNSNISFAQANQLFLRRNLISVFLPGGSITSLAFFSKDLESKQISKTKINFASYVYAVVGILSVFVVALPVILYLLFSKQNYSNVLWAFGILVFILTLIGLITWSLRTRGWVYKLLMKFTPETELIWIEINQNRFSKSQLLKTIFISVLIEFIGIAHLYIAMQAIGFPHPEAAVIGYIVATIFLIISPFLRGMGAIELSLTLLLIQFGLTTAQAASITILYRLFEFWLPLVAGLMSFVFTKGNILLRILPAVLLFALGLVNIVSVLTPAIQNRLKLLAEFLPKSAIHASNYLVLLIGVMLIITASFLIRGLKNAWYLALALCIFSLIGHITKAFDYEEASLALVVIITLLYTRKEYFIKANRQVQTINLATALWTFLAITIYGVVGFYFLDKRHFDIDFSLNEAIVCTFDNFILINNENIQPQTHFAHLFLYSINVLGFGALSFVFYTLLKPYIFEQSLDEGEILKAKALVEKYGNSPVDYFKTYADKSYFFSQRTDGFVAYRIARGFAIALEGPVCENNEQAKSVVIDEFETFCTQNGLKTAYYRIDEANIQMPAYSDKKSLLIGQEAIVDLQTFTLEGKERKSMRNAINSVLKKNYHTKIQATPHSEKLLQQLKSVSDNWLLTMNREELVFSQGQFDKHELSQQTLVTLEDEHGEIVAFLNIIPDYTENETTYDMIRKSGNAPGGNMDVLLVELINYSKRKGYKYLNMGLAPLSGIESGKDLPEKTIKFAYEKIQQFKHYRGLRDFKEKFNPKWRNKYVIYQHHYDLLQLPVALSKVMKP